MITHTNKVVLLVNRTRQWKQLQPLLVQRYTVDPLARESFNIVIQFFVPKSEHLGRRAITTRIKVVFGAVILHYNEHYMYNPCSTS